jgi:hypothetical protein
VALGLLLVVPEYSVISGSSVVEIIESSILETFCSMACASST